MFTDKFLVTTGHPYENGKNPEVLDFSPSINPSKPSIRKVLTSARESRRAGCVGAIFQNRQKIAFGVYKDNGFLSVCLSTSNIDILVPIRSQMLLLKIVDTRV